VPLPRSPCALHRGVRHRLRQLVSAALAARLCPARARAPARLHRPRSAAPAAAAAPDLRHPPPPAPSTSPTVCQTCNATKPNFDPATTCKSCLSGFYTKNGACRESLWRPAGWAAKPSMLLAAGAAGRRLNSRSLARARLASMDADARCPICPPPGPGLQCLAIRSAKSGERAPRGARSAGARAAGPEGSAAGSRNPARRARPPAAPRGSQGRARLPQPPPPQTPQLRLRQQLHLLRAGKLHGGLRLPAVRPRLRRAGRRVR
jgi:hypothetical protein